MPENVQEQIVRFWILRLKYTLERHWILEFVDPQLSHSAKYDFVSL